VSFNRLGELRDRIFGNQRHRDSDLNLVIAAIVLWNAVYLQQATQEQSKQFERGKFRPL